MNFQEILNRFNPDAKILNSEFRKLTNKLKPYQGKVNTDKKVEITPEMAKMGRDLQEKIDEVETEIKDKLLTVFYSLKPEEFKELGFEEYDQLYENLVNNKPNIESFLYLTPMKKETGLEKIPTEKSPSVSPQQ